MLKVLICCFPLAQQPEVIQFGVNPPNRLIVLIFTNPMNPSSCNVQSLTLQSTPDIGAGSSLTPTDGICVGLDPTDPSTVGVMLDPQDWEMIEGDPEFITSMENSYISMTEEFIQNTDGVSNLEIPSSEAFQATIFLTEQPSTPSTETALLDLNTGVLSLSFNQSIGTVNLGLLAITSSVGQYTLTGGIISLFNNGTQANISLTTNDNNLIKVQLLNSQPPASLQLQSGAVISSANVGSVQQSLFLGIGLDSTSPVVIVFSLDMNSGIVALTFSEPIFSNTTNLSAVFITTSSQNVLYSLENAQIFTSTPFVEFSIPLTSLTLNQLKNNTSIATSVQNTFLVTMQSSFHDLFGNGIAQSLILQVTQFSADVTSPQLLSFSVDLNSGNLQLTFSEPINSASVSPAAMTITNSQQTQSLTLAESSIALSSLNTILELVLPDMNLNEIKLLVSNGGNPLRLSINSSAASDTNSNPVVPIAGIIPSSFIQDVTPPNIVNFAAAPQPPNNLTIAMMFNEYLNISTFNISALTLTLASTLGSRSYTGLNGGSLFAPNPQFVIYGLSQSDMEQDQLVVFYQAAYFSGNLSVTFGADLATDLAGNQVTPRVNPLVYPSPQSDPGSPQLMGFDLDLVNSQLTMNFSENVFVLSPSGTITVQSTASAPTSSITLTASYSSLIGSTGASITLPIDQVDRQALISYAGLATNISNTYLVVSTTFAADYSGNYLMSQAPVQASNVDAPPPPVLTATGADFDLNTGRLTLSFSSSVLFSSVDVDGLVLTNGTTQVAITDAASVVLGSELNDTVDITLLNSDINQLKLAMISLQWNVSVPSGLVLGVNGGLNQDGNIRLSNFTVDTTPPLLVGSSFDLNVGQLRLTFSEPIPSQAIILPDIYIGSTLLSAPQGISLAGGAILTGLNTTQIIQLPIAILNDIKANTSIGTSLSDTFVFLSTVSVVDLYGNLLQATGSQITSYIPDSTQPELLSVSMDLNAGTLTMTFLEPVSPSTFNSSSIVITPNAPPGPVITSAPVLITGVSATLSNTILSGSIIDSLNEVKIVLAGQASAYLVAPAGMVSDISGNPSVNIFTMTSLISDTTLPVLTNVLPNQIPPVSLNNMSITFVFSEPVLLSSLDITVVNMETEFQGDLSSFDHFSGGIWQTDSTSAVYYFSENDLNADDFAMRFLTGTYVTYVLVRVEGTLASDLAGNPLSPSSNDFQHNGQGQTPPGPPSLTSFSLDLVSGVMQLSFSEPVVIQIIPNMVTIQNSDFAPTQLYVLTSNQYSSQENLLGSSIILTLLPADRDAIGLLVTSTPNPYLMIQQSFALDYEGNEVIPGAIQVSNLTLPLSSTAAVASSTVTASSTSLPTSSFSSTVSVASSTAAPIESSIEASSTVTAPMETSIAVSSTIAAPVETSIAVSSTIAAPVETTIAVSSTIAAPAVSSTIAAPAETSTAVSSTVVAVTTSVAPSVPSTTQVEPAITSVIEPSSTPMEPVATTTMSPASTTAGLPTSSIVSPSPSPTATPSLSPMLTAATLDLNIGSLAMTFDVPVTASSVVVTSVTFMNSGGSSYSITGSQGVTAVGSNGASVSLSKTDLDAMKFFLHMTPGTTWSVRLNQDAVTSTNGISNQQQTLALSSITPDTTAPSIVSFSLNLNSGRVVLTFSEPIDSTNYSLQQVFLNGSSGGLSGYNLLGSTVSTSFFSTIFDFVLSSTALNAVKLDSSVATSSSNTFMFMSSQSFRDVGGNPIAALTTGLQVNTFIPDSTSPELSSFTLDLDSGLLSLTFSEAIQVSSFDAAGIRITNNAQQQAVAVNDFTMGGNTGATEVYLTLLSTLNDVKLLITSSGALQAYLSITSAVASDTFGNTVVAIPNATPQAAASVTADTTAPQITTFVAGTPSTTTSLTFSFNEYVSTTSWNEASITLYLNTPLGDFTYSDLSGGTVSSSVSSTTAYTFSSSYFQGQFALRYQQAYFSGSIGVTFTSGLVRDVSNNMVLPQTSPLTYNSTTSDPVHPQLQSFSLNLNMGQLTMTFSEPIEVREIPGNVRLQNSATSPSFIHTLVSSGYSSQQGTTGQIITLTLQQVDISGLNINENLGSSVSDTFLFLASDFAVDFSANSLVAQTSAVQATSVIVFSGPIQPHVIAFDLDLDSNQLTFEFDTPVQASSFDPTLVTLVNTSTISTQTTLIRLTNVTVIARNDQQKFRVLLSTADTVNVKQHPLCYTAANCFAVFDQGVVTSGTLLSAAVMTPLMVSDLLPDVTPPRFLSFPVFDLNSGFFTIIFTEPINGSSADFTLVTFANSLSNPSETVKLTEGVTSPDHVEIDFHMPRDDLNALKYRLNLCTSRDNCWIQLPSFFISDIGNNPFLHSNYLPNAQASYHQPTVFITDTTPPVLEAFDVDLNQGKLVLSFTEVIDIAQFSPGDITLLNAPFSAIRLVLNNASELTRVSNGTAIEVIITSDDLNWVKSKDLFTSSATSYLSMQTDLTDVSGNEFVDIHHSNPQRVANLTIDTTPPLITAFYYFNIDNGSFYIRFDEPVDSGSIDITKITLRSGVSPSSPSMRLTGGIARTLDSGRMEIEVQLSHDDRIAIKLISGLATAQTNTWILLDASTIRDTGGNNNTALSSPLSLITGGFIPDTTTASLLSVSLDMNQEILRMLFSDVIDASSITQTLLRIQNNASTPDRFFNLTSTSLPWSTSSDIVEISISLADLNSLKRDLNLATNITNTYFSFSGLFARDVENRFVDSVPFSNAQRTMNYTRDTTNPQLQSYKLDMDTGVLYFTFDEPVLIDAVDPSAVTLFNTPNSPTDQYQLSGGTASPMIVGAPADTLVSLQLSYTDLNTIKGKTSLATTITNLYLSFTAGFIQDTSNVPVVAVTTLLAASYEPDTTLPELEYFDTDLTDGGTITMKFSEAVQFTNTIQSTVMLQNSMTGAGIQFGLDATEAAAIASSLKDRINITLSSSHTNRLLNDPLIGSSTSNLYLSIIAGGVYDFSDGSIGLGQSIAPTTKRVRNICK